ncbi:MAG TPA: endonuclease domain-containing protein [Patescibacteria group bacterium]|nr:endonuclease domain-containing protein [Patescibacteria group bacterium]
MAKLVKTEYNLPYNPALKERAREMRKSMTTAEKRLWFEFLHKHPLRFFRQRPIDNYIVDFYCPEKKLVIEVDGDSHYTLDSVEYDKNRTDILERYGLNVLRFTNFDVLKNFPGVCARIEEILKGLTRPSDD